MTVRIGRRLTGYVPAVLSEKSTRRGGRNAPAPRAKSIQASLSAEKTIDCRREDLHRITAFATALPMFVGARRPVSSLERCRLGRADFPHSEGRGGRLRPSHTYIIRERYQASSRKYMKLILKIVVNGFWGVVGWWL